MRTTCIAIVTLVLLLGSTGAVTAVMNEEEIITTFVTGTVTDSTEIEDEGRVFYEQTVDWSDPRLPSTLLAEGSWYIYGDLVAAMERMDAGASESEAFAGLVMVVELSVLLDGADGSWQGTGRGIEGNDDRYSYYVLSGDGAFEGFHALLRGAPGHDVDGPWDKEYEGWIIESPLPPVPPLPEPAEG